MFSDRGEEAVYAGSCVKSVGGEAAAIVDVSVLPRLGANPPGPQVPMSHPHCLDSSIQHVLTEGQAPGGH